MDNSLFIYSENITNEYIQNTDIKMRKLKGQFFTPKAIALFMASLFEINGEDIKLLDPGAGAGILSLAFCYHILNFKKTISLTIDAYENDANLIPYLEKSFKRCKSLMEKNGHSFEYRIIEKDFILNKLKHLRQRSIFEKKEPLNFYDYIISNPPYYKLGKNSSHTLIMNEFTSGQPNIYAFFMALSLEMLKPDGQMVFITPRSFCSGLYFKRFREWLLTNGIIDNIHIFESRNTVFNKNEILQENIIMKIRHKSNNDQNTVIITTSKDKSFLNVQKLILKPDDILHKKNGNVFIKIPTKTSDLKIQNIINSWEYTLKDLGMKISTGPVVSFRAKNYLSFEFINNKTSPLLWMHNINGFDVVWPLEKKKKEIAIKIGNKTESLLIPTNNYVLLKRFSSKEQKKRLYAGVLLKSDFNDFEKIGIENHLNYIYKCNEALSVEEAYGIAGILNTTIVDEFFRMMNGNTQVNAIDIMNLPLPSIDAIREIGKLIRMNRTSIEFDLNMAVSKILGIDISFLLTNNNKDN